MCWGAYGPRADESKWSTLWSDDIAGVRQNHRKLRGSDGFAAPPWADEIDAEATMEVENPWPGYVPNNHPAMKDSEVQLNDQLSESTIDFDNLLGSVDL